MPIPSEPFLILLIPLHIRRGGIEEEKVHFQVQQIGGGEEDFLLDELFMLQEEIHGPIEMLKGDGLGISQGHILSDPFLHAPFGIRSQGSVSHHGKNSPFHRRSKLSVLKGLNQSLLKSQPFPQNPKNEGPTHRRAFNETQGLEFSSHIGLNSKSLFRCEEPAEAFDQAFDGLYIQRVSSAKGVEDVGPGKTGFGISDIMGELDVGSGGAVFVLAGNGSDIHAYSYSIYLYLCQEKNYIMHAYVFLNFGKSTLCNINNLA